MNFELIFVLIFLFTCFFTINKYLKTENGVFTAPFISSMMTLSTVTPQLYIIYSDKFYDKNLIYDLVLVIVSCLICLNIGFSTKFVIKRNELIKDIKFKNLNKILFLYIVFGFIGLLVYREIIHGDYVIAGLFQAFGLVASIIIIYIIIENNKNKKSNNFYFVLLFCALVPILDFALNVKGSRSRVFYVLLLFFYLFGKLYPKFKNTFKYSFFLLFIVGSVMSSSIVEYRDSIKGNSSNNNVSYLDNYLSSFSPLEISTNGMDLGNAALGIKYCKDNFYYTYGLIFIDRLIFNFVPSRLFGEDTKQDLFLCPDEIKLQNKYTNEVTTMTGFYEVFNCFSYFGCIIFYIIGRFMKYCWIRSNFSLFYFLIYFYSIVYLNIAISHGVTYFFSNLFTLFITSSFILLMYSYKKKLN